MMDRLIPLALAAYGGWFLVRYLLTRHLLRVGEGVEATVIHYRVDTNDNYVKTYQPIVEYTVDGRCFQKYLPLRDIDPPAIGDTVTIYFHPRRLQWCALPGQDRFPAMPIFFCAFAAAIVLYSSRFGAPSPRLQIATMVLYFAVGVLIVRARR